MKKFTLLVAAAFALVSCSDNDNGGSGSGTGMLEKMVYTFDGGFTETLEYEYNGSKLSQMTYEGGNIEVTYTGDNITEMLTYEGEAEPVEAETYEYDSMGRISVYTYKEMDFGFGIKEMYVHNDDGTISFTRYEGDEFSQNDLQNTGKIFFEGSEVSKIEEYWPGYTTVTEYEYDDKKNPSMMITGMGKISFVGGYATGINHNILSETYTDEFETYTDSSTYTYTAAEYPATQQNNDPEENYSVQYFYN